MTKLLEQAFEKLLQLPASKQDHAAQVLLDLVEDYENPESVDAETWAAIEEGLDQARRGEFVSDEDMAEFFRQRGA